LQEARARSEYYRENQICFLDYVALYLKQTHSTLMSLPWHHYYSNKEYYLANWPYHNSQLGLGNYAIMGRASL